MDPSEDYVYEGLDGDRPHFRLLKLDAGTKSHIKCQLFTVFFDESDTMIDYEALSYTWGGLEREKTISLDGKSFAITANLYTALYHLRRPDCDRILWIDAICINQANKREQSHQVRQMTDIYRRALKVNIWLGEANEDTRAMMDALNLLDLRAAGSGHWALWDPRWKTAWERIQDELESGYVGYAGSRRTGLQTLLDHPRFERVWVLQEAACARAATVMCGSDTISARFINMAPSLLRIAVDEHHQAVLDVFPGLLDQKSSRTNSRSLRTLLYKFRKCKATVSRDRVYTLLGICSDENAKKQLAADYEISELQAVKLTVMYVFDVEPEDFDSSGWGQIPLGTLLERTISIDWTAYEALPNPKAAMHYLFAWLQTIIVRYFFEQGMQWSTLADFCLGRIEMPRQTMQMFLPDIMRGVQVVCRIAKSLMITQAHQSSQGSGEFLLPVLDHGLDLMPPTIALDLVKHYGYPARLALDNFRFSDCDEAKAWSQFLCLALKYPECHWSLGGKHMERYEQEELLRLWNGPLDFDHYRQMMLVDQQRYGKAKESASSGSCRPRPSVKQLIRNLFVSQEHCGEASEPASSDFYSHHLTVDRLIQNHGNNFCWSGRPNTAWEASQSRSRTCPSRFSNIASRAKVESRLGRHIVQWLILYEATARMLHQDPRSAIENHELHRAAQREWVRCQTFHLCEQSVSEADQPRMVLADSAGTSPTDARLKRSVLPYIGHYLGANNTSVLYVNDHDLCAAMEIALSFGDTKLDMTALAANIGPWEDFHDNSANGLAAAACLIAQALKITE